MDVNRIGPRGSLVQGDSPDAALQALRHGQILVGRVLAAEGKMARVDVEGRTMDVQTAVPLAAGDELRLKVAIGARGQVRLQVMALAGKESLLGDAHLSALLEKMGLPPGKATLDAARALLAESGTVDPQAVRDLAKLAASLAGPEQRAAAAFLIARGLPATPGAVVLLAGGPPEGGAAAGRRLARRLEAMERLAPQLLEALAGLDLGSQDDGAALGQALARLVRGLTPPESALAAALEGRSEDLPDKLAQNFVAILERAARDAPDPATRQAARELANDLRAGQLVNAQSVTRPDPAEVRIPLVWEGRAGELTVQTWQGNARDPAGHARVVLDLDMDALGHVTADLMVAKGHVGGRLTVADEATGAYLRERLAELADGLGRAGIGVGHLEVGTPREPAGREAPMGRFDLKL